MIYYAILASVIVSLYLLNFLVSSYRRRILSRELGCKEPEVHRLKWPGGVDMVWRFNDADKRDRVPDEFLTLEKEHSRDTWEWRFFGRPQIVTSNPKNTQAVLATQFQDFEIGPQRKRVFFPMLGNGIFTEDGKPWEHSRAMLRPQFTRDQVSDLELEETHVQLMFEHLETDASGWTAQVDLGPLFFRLTMDSATEFLFGQSVESQLWSLPRMQNSDTKFEWRLIGDCFDNGTHALGIRNRLFDLYWLHNPSSFRKNCKEVKRFADHFVKIALEREKNVIDNSGKKQRYVFLQELVKVTKNPDVLRDQLLNILLAGRDTTAGLLGWACWSLARNPAIYQKLRATILEDFGTYEKPRDITFARLKACSYLQYTLNETLRLFPSVPLNTRQATKDTSIPVGGGPDGKSPIFIEKDEPVTYCVYVMHRRKDLWGPDADEFKPDRWYGRKAGWEYLPFNGGPRICLGQQFALTEAGYVLTRLIQKFDKIENCDPIGETRHQYSVTSAPKRVLVRLHEAGKKA